WLARSSDREIVECISRHLAKYAVVTSVLGEVSVRNACQRVRPFQRDIEHESELIGIPIGKRSQKHRIHNAEHRGVDADAQRESKYGDCAEAGRFSQDAKPVA